MRYCFGTVLFVVAAAFLWSGLRHRRRVLAIASREAIEAQRMAATEDPRSMAALAEIGRPVVLFFLAWVGVKSGLAYVWLDAGRWLLPFDLAGFYALLLAYGVSFSLESTYRISDAIAAAEGEHRGNSQPDTTNRSQASAPNAITATVPMRAPARAASASRPRAFASRA